MYKNWIAGLREQYNTLQWAFFRQFVSLVEVHNICCGVNEHYFNKGILYVCMCVCVCVCVCEFVSTVNRGHTVKHLCDCMYLTYIFNFISDVECDNGCVECVFCVYFSECVFVCTTYVSSVGNQKGTIIIQWYSIENLKGAITIQGGPERMQHLRSLMSKKPSTKSN